MIIVTGSIAWDFIIDFPGKFADHILPDQIHKLNISFNVNHYAKRRGGTAANACYNLGLLHTPSLLFSIVGKDFTEYRQDFQNSYIDLSRIATDKNEYISTGFAITDKANNQIWGYSYGAAKSVSKLKLKKFAQKKDIILVGPNGLSGTMGFVRQCINLHLQYMFDPSFILTDMTNKDVRLGISHAAYVIGNDYEMTLIKNRLPEWKILFQDKVIITTLGEKGAVIEQNGKVFVIKPVKVKKVIDPTGAGDAWRSGFLAGLSKGFDMQVCGQMGAVAASFALEKYGTQEHTYTLQTFKNRYRQTYKSLLSL